MTTIYFVRHGESTANLDGTCAGHTDVELTDQGREQAISAGVELQNSGIGSEIEKIVSSPLKRSYETACLIANQIGYPVESIIVTDLAIERYRGRYEGQPSSMQDDASEDDYIRMGAESTIAMIERAARLQNFVDELKAKTVLIVSHNQFGRIFVPTIRGDLLGALGKLPNAHVFKI